MADRIWKSLGGLDEENQASRKSIIQTDFLDTEKEGSVCINYRLSGYWEADTPYDQEEVTLLDIPQAGFVTEVGAPMLVREGLFVAIPDNAEFLSVDAEIIERTELQEKYDILPVPQEALETEELNFNRNDAIYESGEVYPPQIVEYVQTTEICGARCIHLFVYPFQYRPLIKQLTALTELKITVHFTYEHQETDNHIGSIGNTFYNSQLLGYQPERENTDSSKKPRMVIITTEEFAYALRILEGVKTFLYDVEIVYLENIRQQYPEVDNVEAIHSYLMDEHQKTPISYAILGGGIDKIPSKRIYDSQLRKEIANDNYYCSASDRSKPLPLFALGRLPVSTIQEMHSLADYAAYYNRFFNDTRKKAVFTAYDDDSRGYKKCKQDIISTLDKEFSITECYEGSCSKAELIDAINKGVGFVNYRGHGSYTAWSSKNGLSTKDISKLNVERNTPNVFSIACNNCAIHQSSCLGVEWMRQLKAISFLGASAPSYTTVNHVFDKYLWEGIHQQKLTKAGDIFVWATLELYRNRSDKYAVTNILEYLLLGDPTADYMEDKTER